MYKELSASLLKKYKEDNILFVKIFSALSIFVLPLFLLFAPLPAYFLYTSSVASLPFLISAIIMLIFTILSAKFYDKIHLKQYLFWAIHLTSYSEVRNNYCFGQLSFSWVTLALLIAGFFKVDNIYHALPKFVFILITQYAYFRYRFKKSFEPRFSNAETSLHHKIFYDIFSKIVIHIIIFIIFLTFAVALVAKAKVNSVSLIVSLTLISICTTLSFTMGKIAFREISTYKMFIISISYKLFKKIVGWIKIISIVFNSAPILVYFSWLARVI